MKEPTVKNSNIGVVIVDMQDFFLNNFDKDKVNLLVENHVMLLKHCKQHKIPIFVLEYEKRGETIKPIQKYLDSIPHAHIITKKFNSGFRQTNLEILLKDLNIKIIVLAGINGSGCVQDTAIGAIKRGFKIVTARGIIASNTKRDTNLATSKRWYSKNGMFFESVGDLLYYIKNNL